MGFSITSAIQMVTGLKSEYVTVQYLKNIFLPCCIEYRHSVAMKILSVCLSNAWFVTKQKKILAGFLYQRQSATQGSNDMAYTLSRSDIAQRG